jgi:hypothetical protein
MRYLSIVILLFGATSKLFPTVNVVENSTSRTLIELSFDNPQNPEIYLLAVPNNSDVEIKILDENKVPLLLTQFETGEKAFEIIKRGIWRDFDVVTLKFYPQIRDEKGDLYFIKYAMIELSYRGGTGYPEEVTPTFAPLYEEFIINYPSINPRIKDVTKLVGYGARYLIIAPDAFYDALLPLAEWKTQKGMLAKIVTLSETGSNPSQIKAYIQNAYNNWDIKPEFVLLAGGYSYIPRPTENDHYYVMLDADEHDDIVVGRFPADNLTQIQTMVSKTLGYEKNPYMEDSLWFKKGVTIVREDYDPPDDSIYHDDALYAMNLMISAGYIHIDYLSRDSGNDASDVIAAIDDGRTYVLYRGQGVGYWWSPFNVDPSYTNNGFKLPVVVSATCSSSGSDELGEDFLRVGTPTNPKGSVGFFGTTTVRSNVAHIRSYIAKGFFRGLFVAGNYQLGVVTDYARYNLYRNLGNDPDYHGFFLLGDPELNLWTDTPGDLIVTHPPLLPPGYYELTVNVSSYGGAIKNALVCAMVDTLEYVWGYTDTFGEVTLPMNLPDSGTVRITVTAYNYHYYEGTAVISAEGPYVSMVYHTLDDNLYGNGDGYINPGEMPFVDMVLKNFGNQMANEVEGVLRTLNPHVNVIDSTEFFGDIPPGDSVNIDNAFSFTIDSTTPHGEIITFNLVLFDAAGDTWISQFSEQVHAARLEIVSESVIDTLQGGNGNGIPEPGESFLLTITVTNSGEMTLNSISLNLIPSDLDPFIAITDPTSYLNQLNPGDTITISSDPFALAANPVTPLMHRVDFNIIISGQTDTYTYDDTSSLSLVFGEPGPQYPGGPDEYGYYVIDNSDSLFTICPTFEWVEIAPPGPGQIISEITNEDADTVTLPLPFTFRFYGVDYDSIGVCSNGFLELGRATYRFGYNDPIPSIGGPKRLLSPFWCDLDPAEGGDIYAWYDASNHRYIIEFKEVVHWGGYSPETFEVILYDPSYYPTPTGDGEIVFQYLVVSDPSSCTVGIEDSTETVGIQYLYNGNYDVTSSPLEDGRAILFTTKIPVSYGYPWTYLNPEYLIIDSTGNGNGIPEPGETFELYLEVFNGGSSSASNLFAILYSLNENCMVIDSTAIYGNIEPEEGQWNYGDPFIITVSPDPVDSLMDFQLDIIANSGNYQYHLYFSIPLSINVNVLENSNRKPTTFSLTQNFPNPVRENTEIEFAIPYRTRVSLSIYDVSGRRIATLLDDIKEPGFYRVIWNGRDSMGRRVPSGIYFYRFEAGKFIKTRKMVLITN